jgi:hypothetical protein
MGIPELPCTAPGLAADRLAFGPEGERSGIPLHEATGLRLSCIPCQVQWAASTGTDCWNCGQPGSSTSL